MSGIFGGGQTNSTTDTQIGSMRVQTSAYGVAIPIGWGKPRITGNLLWYGDFTAIPHTSTQESGGKGGGEAPTNTTFSYTAAVIIGLCEGMVYDIPHAWASKSKYTGLDGLGLSIFSGSYSQSPWGYMTTYHPGEDLAYRGQAYVASAAVDLGSNADLPNLTYEVITNSTFGGGIVDANPKDVVVDYLTNPYYGVGFPAEYLPDYDNFSTYCRAAGLFISPALEEQQEGQEWLAEFVKMANSEVVFSEALLKIIPYGDTTLTANGATYSPDLTPAYDLTDDDVLEPIKVTRKTPADAFNMVRVEFLNRDLDYNVDIADAQDQANIELFGLRPMDPIQLHGICDPVIAQKIAYLILQRVLYVRNEYKVIVGWKYCLVEAMDLLTLTDSDPDMDLDQAPVLVVSTEENEDGDITLVVEDFPIGIAHAALYPSQPTAGTSLNFNVAAGNVNPPVMFEPPDQLAGGLQVWLAVSGQANWGGCNIWISTDNATYKNIGRITGAARQGVLSAALASGSDLDEIHTLSVDLTQSLGELISASTADADSLQTLCYVDGELIAYGTSVLLAANKYNLTYLVRGAYGSTIGAHNVGTQFARLDQAMFSYPFAEADIGKTIYLKFQSFNSFGAGVQTLADIEPYNYVLEGSALNSPLPNVANVTTNFVSGITQIYWDVIEDFRTPIDYEVRVGVSWAAGAVVGRTPIGTIPAIGDGTYWIAGHYRSPLGVEAYSALPQSVVISGAVLTRNVVATYSEAGTGWTGTYSGGAYKLGSVVQLAGAGDILSATDILSELDILWLGGVAPTGTYRIPVGHRVNIGRVAPCNIIISLSGYAQSIYDNILTVTDFLNVADVLGAALGPEIGLQPQIALAGADGVYGAWQNYVPGIYNAQYFDAQVVLTSTDPQIDAVLSGFIFTVDVPDRIDRFTNQAIAAGGTPLVYSAPFNAIPNVQVTILSAVAGDDVLLTSSTVSGVTIQVVNGGVGVARNVNAIAQSY